MVVLVVVVVLVVLVLVLVFNDGVCADVGAAGGAGFGVVVCTGVDGDTAAASFRFGGDVAGAGVGNAVAGVGVVAGFSTDVGYGVGFGLNTDLGGGGAVGGDSVDASGDDGIVGAGVGTGVGIGGAVVGYGDGTGVKFLSQMILVILGLPSLILIMNLCLISPVTQLWC